MLRRLIDYFAHNHLLINFIFFLTLASGIYYWTITGKEALPNVEFNFVRISMTYPGAAAEDVEIFITSPIENALKSVENIHRVRSTSSRGSSSLFVEIENTADLMTTVNNIETAVRGVSFPNDIRSFPQVRQFKTSQRAVIDIALTFTNQHILDFENRSHLQDLVLVLENRLSSLAAVSSISKSGYLKKRLRIELLPEKLKFYQIPITEVFNRLTRYDLKVPLGKLDDLNESELVVADTDYSPEQLKNIIIRGTYLNPEVRLGEVSQIYYDFEKKININKVNGHEAVIINIIKNGSYGILQAVDEIKNQVDRFSTYNPEINVVYIDDESTEVRNRISLIGNNGIIGFTLILLLLFLLLDFNSGFWVAMGIPFTFSFTMIVAHFLGFNVNNVTLAGVIIVMGMIVDDAIVVVENIVRKKREGIPRYQAVVDGTLEMLLPITASVITTCIAFLPMFVIEGRFAQMVAPIPTMVIIMLIASLLESLFLLPGHVNYTLPPSWINKFPWLKKTNFTGTEENFVASRDWFSRVEDAYGNILRRLLRHRYIILFIFASSLVWAGYRLVNHMNFILFPNEESTQVFLTGKAIGVSKREQTAEVTQLAEAVLQNYHQEVTSYRTDIGQSRRRRQILENEFIIRVELVPKEKREKSLNQLTEEWLAEFEKISELEISIIRQRFGRSEGAGALEIVILDDDDSSRVGALESLQSIMASDPTLRRVEIDKQTINEGFRVKIDRSLIDVAGVDGKNLVSTLRTILNGQVIEEIPEANDKIDILLTVPEASKKNVEAVMNFPIALNNGDIIPLNFFVQASPSPIPTTIYRESYRRVGRIYADIEDYSNPPEERKDQRSSNQGGGDGPRKSQKEEKNQSPKTPSSPPPEGWILPTPLQIAERYEEEIFPTINAQYPNTIVYFDGEVKESRESKNDFTIAFIAVLVCMFMVLSLLFHSLIKPLIVMIIIPFGIVGTVLAFYFHGKESYGFFGLLGFLGLTGVVVNDTIVMLSRFQNRLRGHLEEFHHDNFLDFVAETAKTRLRAIIMTTITTVVGLFPTIYGLAGYDSLLAEMMFVMAWGLMFSTLVTLILLPILYSIMIGWQIKHISNR